MKRALGIVAIMVACLIGLAVFVGGVLLYTPPGRDFIVAQAEPAIADALGGDVDIETLKGRLPGHLIVEDVVLTDEEGVWARIDRAEMRWRPFRLLGGAVDIASLTLNGGAIYREPPDELEEEEDEEPFTIALPEELPDVRIEALEINNLRSSLGGVDARIDGGGMLAMGGERINARINLTSAGDADTIDLAVNIAPDAERVYIDATIAAAENGLVAAFADLGGPVFIEIDGDSPTDAAEISLNALVGAYGRIDARFLADLQNAVSVTAEGAFAPGARLSDIEELGEPVQFNIDLQDEERGGRMTINRLVSAAGSLAGDVAWRNLREADNDLAIDLRATLAEGYRPEIQNYLGRDITLTTNMKRRPEDYETTLRIRGGDVDAEVTDGLTDLRKNFAGALVATIAARDDFPPQPLRVETRFAVDLDDKASLRALAIEMGEALDITGEADFTFADESLRFEGDVDAGPEFVSSLSPSMVPEGRITATLEAAGVADRFTLTADAEIPVIMIGENSAPALVANIALSGLPRLPTGDVSARAKNGAGAFSATLRSSETGRIAAPSLTYQGPDFSLNGAGAYNPETQRGEIDLVYNGGETAEPWPGVSIVGELTARGQFAREGQRTDLTVSAPSLSANDVIIDDLSLRAAGPPAAIEATLTAARIAASDTNEVRDINVAATIDAADDIRVRLTELVATLYENTARLLEPGTISVADGVSLENIRLGWGREGRIAVDGAFTEERWRGDINFAEVNIPRTDGRVTATINLDTNNAEPATGSFTLRSLVTEEEATISGSLRWDGDVLNLTSLPDRDALDMRLALPAQLTREPSLSVATDGPLDGYVRYDGPITPFAAFLPPDLQTLEGFLAINFDIDGTTDAPALTGVAEITEGAYTELRSGLSIAGLNTRADANVSPSGTRIAFSGGARGGGQSGEDTITISGDMALADESRLDLNIALNNAELSAHPINTLRADGNVAIAGPLDAIEAKGEITIHELDAEIVTPESTGLEPIEVVNIDEADDNDPLAEPPPTTFFYDVSIEADDRIFVRGRGLETEWSADVRAVSVKGEPVILGSMRLRRGTLDFAGRRFDIGAGRVSFDRLSPNNPVLDIRADLDANGVTASINISGRAQDPSIELTSVPDRPDEDIMALVLFGKPADELTAFESLQTAQALASLGGVGPFGGGGGLTGSLRQATGLDMLNFDVDPESGGGSLTVGKYVADGLFVSATQDAQGKGGSVIVEYEITDNISVETEVRQDGDQTVSANWKKDF